MIIDMQKSGKFLENCNADMENAECIVVTLLITHAFGI